MCKVSVIMPVYNTPIEYIDKSVKSILAQTYNDFEFIIINDGSDEECSKYLKKISTIDSRVILYENDGNKGLTFSLNRGIDLANGEYIARMDSDDIAHCERFKDEVEILDNNLDVDLVATNANLFDENGVWGVRRYNYIISKKDFLVNSPIVHPSIMVRKNTLIKCGKYYDIKRTLRCEDYDLFMRMMASNCKIVTIQKELMDFREDSGAFARRKFKYRISEFKTRLYGYKKMGILFPLGIIFCFKPILVGLLPKCIYRYVKKRKERVR